MYHKRLGAANANIRHKFVMIQLLSSKLPRSTAPLQQSIRFDTRRPGRLVGGLFLLCGTALAFCVWALSHKLGTMSEQQSFAAMLLITAAQYWMALWCFRHYAGAHGTIDRKTVTIEPDKLFGLSTLSLRGQFTVARFHLLRLQGRPRGAARLTLVGAIAEIVLFNGSMRNATALANEIGLLLRLPIETITPTA